MLLHLFAIPILAGIAYSLFPGILIVRQITGLDNLSRLIAAIFLSLSFWIAIAWLLPLLHIPFSWGYLALLLAAMALFAFQVLQKKYPFIPISITNHAPIGYYIMLGFAALALMLPIAFKGIPPGCDTAMHGYIARLIVNANSLPTSYRPVLPVGYFGSYSAGYHLFTALFAGFKPSLLRYSILFISFAVYPLSLLSFVFFLRRFVGYAIAISVAILFWGVNSSLQGTVGWGGNPTMLAFAFSIFCFGFLHYAVHTANKIALLLLAFPLAAILLTHAIPAAVFAYLLLPFAIFLIVQYRHTLRQWLPTTIAGCGLAIVLLLPFLLHFKNDNSAELIVKIKNWQNLMMGNRISTRFADNLAAMADETKYKIGDILTILSGLSLVLLAVKKQYKTIAVALVFVLYIYLLILNCAYWVLPASELLYPERIAYFMIVPLACLFALMIDIYKGYSLSFNKGKVKIKIALFLATGLGIFGLIRIYNGSQELIHEKTVLIDANTLNSIEWINTHTPSNAIFTASYNDAGMWLPTLCNRPTIGTHLHFIHEIMHINDTLQASNAPHYYFVTTKDTTEHTHITTLISSKTLVYTNSGVWIYR